MLTPWLCCAATEIKAGSSINLSLSMHLFARIHALLSRLSRYAVWLGGLALLLSAVMVTVDVFARKFFSVTMSGSDEITGYVFAAATTWAYSYCLINRSNVRIDAVYNFIPRAVRAILDILGMLLLLIYMSYLTVKAFDVFWTSWQRDSVSITTLATPLWIPQLLWFTGLVLFCLTLIFMLAYTITAFAKQDIRLVQQLAGAMSAQEEVVHETQSLEKRL